MKTILKLLLGSIAMGVAKLIIIFVIGVIVAINTIELPGTAEAVHAVQYLSLAALVIFPTIAATLVGWGIYSLCKIPKSIWIATYAVVVTSAFSLFAGDWNTPSSIIVTPVVLFLASGTALLVITRQKAIRAVITLIGIGMVFCTTTVFGRPLVLTQTETFTLDKQLAKAGFTVYMPSHVKGYKIYVANLDTDFMPERPAEYKIWYGKSSSEVGNIRITSLKRPSAFNPPENCDIYGQFSRKNKPTCNHVYSTPRGKTVYFTGSGPNNIKMPGGKIFYSYDYGTNYVLFGDTVVVVENNTSLDTLKIIDSLEAKTPSQLIKLENSIYRNIN